MSNKNNNIRQGDIYWLDYQTPGYPTPKTRPCVVVSATEYNNPGSDVMVCPMSSSVSRDDLPCNVYVGEPVKPEPTWCKVSQVCTVPAERLKSDELCGKLEPIYLDLVLSGIIRQMGRDDEAIDPGELELEAEREAYMLGGDYGDGDEVATYPAEA